MNSSPFDMREFMKSSELERTASPADVEPESVEDNSTAELDVQKAVVEELAADKVRQDEQLAGLEERIRVLEGHIKTLKEQNGELKGKLNTCSSENAQLKDENAQLRDENVHLKETEISLKQANIALENALSAAQEKEFDLLERNPNALALLDRDVELPDRFPGESRDHVLEALIASRDRAEAEGRCRCAQVLEGVLLANEPNGTLAKRRAEIERLFAENSNIVSGPVIEALKNMGISHKNGEDYLLPSEIIKRNY